MHFSVINDKVDGIITVISLAIVTRALIFYWHCLMPIKHYFLLSASLVAQ